MGPEEGSPTLGQGAAGSSVGILLGEVVETLLALTDSTYIHPTPTTCQTALGGEDSVVNAQPSSLLRADTLAVARQGVARQQGAREALQTS